MSFEVVNAILFLLGMDRLEISKVDMELYEAIFLETDINGW